jgi:hypothetical protein
VGLTVVAFGTSAPEFVVSVRAALAGQGAIAIGNVIGSNTLNIGLILGLTALIMIGVSLLAAWMLTDHVIGRPEGAVLAGGLIACTAFTVLFARKVKPSAEVEAEFAESMPAPRGSVWHDLLFIVAASACPIRASGPKLGLRRLADDFLHHFAIHIGEAEIAAEMAPGELEVIDAELVQDGRVQVVDVDFAGHGAVAHVVGLAKGEPAFDSAASHPRAEALGLVFASVLLDRCGAAEVLAPRRAAKFAAPHDERVFEQAARFEILEQRSDGLVGLRAELW